MRALIGAGGSVRELGDFKSTVRRIRSRYAFLLTPPWIVGNSHPGVWSDVIEMDSAACGDVVKGTWGIFCLGGGARQHCNINHNAVEIRTLGDSYSRAGLGIQPGPVGIRHIRTIPQTTGAIVSIQTDDRESRFSQFPHLPFPNTGAIRGIGTRRPTTSQGETLTSGQRAVFLVGDYALARMGSEFPNGDFGYWITHTPPLRLYRHALRGACRHFLDNVRGPCREGAGTLFRNDASSTATARAPTVGFPPRLLTRTIG